MAYDSLRWDFLDLVMVEMGFRCKWMRWIEGCLMNVHSSVLVNGTPTDEFDIRRGLLQGEPMSPFCSSLLWKAYMLLSEGVMYSFIYGISYWS